MAVKGWIILNLRLTFKGAELSSPGTLTVMPAVSSILQSLMINFLFFPSDTIWILQVDFVSGESPWELSTRTYIERGVGV